MPIEPTLDYSKPPLMHKPTTYSKTTIAPPAKDHSTPLKHKMINPKLMPPTIEPIDMFQNLTCLFKQLLNRTLSIIESHK
jgi:hypothetical protein